MVNFIDPHAIQRRAAELETDVAQIIYIDGGHNFVRFWSSVPENDEVIK